MKGSGWRVRALTGLVFAMALGCSTARIPDSRRPDFTGHHRAPGRSPEELQASEGWEDLEAQSHFRAMLRPDELLENAARARAANTPAMPFPPKKILVLSGGGIYGAYPAGVLAGWTESGTRPEFDVVTGVSTGAFISVFAFLGPGLDEEMRRHYTSLRSADVFRRRRPLASLLSESFADSAPLARLIEQTVTDQRIAEVAAEHRKGRRLYIATSDLDTRRSVVWDIGALADRGTPADRDLIRKVILASGSVPGFFPPVRIPVNVDGAAYVERHVDGSTTSSMFFAPPYIAPEARAALPPNWLHGSDVYVLVAGKLYADPAPVKSRTLRIAVNAVSTLLYVQTRGDLQKLYLLTVLTGMNYYLTSIPADIPLAEDSTEIVPAEMTRMFEAGREWGRSVRSWRTSPPGYLAGEEPHYRAGIVLTDTARLVPIVPELPLKK